MASARLVHGGIAPEREEDPGGPARPQQCPCRAARQCGRPILAAPPSGNREAEHRDGGLDEQAGHAARARFGDTAASPNERGRLLQSMPNIGPVTAAVSWRRSTSLALPPWTRGPALPGTHPPRAELGGDAGRRERGDPLVRVGEQRLHGFRSPRRILTRRGERRG